MCLDHDLVGRRLDPWRRPLVHVQVGMFPHVRVHALACVELFTCVCVFNPHKHMHVRRVT